MGEVTRRRKRPPRRPPEPAPEAAEPDAMPAVGPADEQHAVPEQSSHTTCSPIAPEAGAGDVEAPKPGPITRRRLRPIGHRAGRRLRNVAGALLVAGLVAALALDTEASVDERLAAYVDGTDRHAFTSAGGRFRAEFPERPVRSTAASQLGGAEVTTVVHRADVGLDNSFLVSYVDLPAPPVDPGAALQAAALATAATVKGELVSTTPSTLGERPALEAIGTVRLDGGTAAVHHSQALFVLDGARLYTVTVIDKDTPPAGYDAFSTSFDVVVTG